MALVPILDSTIDTIVVTPTALPAALSGFTATPGDAKVILRWNPLPTPQSPQKPLRLIVVRSISRTVRSRLAIWPAPRLLIDPSNPVPSNPFTHTGATNGKTYRYAACVVDEWGRMSPQVNASATPIAPPNALVNFLATGIDTAVILSWDPDPRRRRGGAAQEDRAQPSNCTDTSAVALTVPLGSTSYIDSGRTNKVVQNYIACASLNLPPGGTTSRLLSSSARAKATPTPSPGPVSGLGSVAGDRSVLLAWKAVPSGLAIILVRRVGTQPTSCSDTQAELLVVGPGETSYDDVDLTNGTTYHYAICVTDGAQVSAPVRTSGTPTTSPIPGVVGFGATAGDGVIRLTWSSIPAGATLVVRRAIGESPASCADASATAIPIPLNVTSHLDTQLPNGTEVHYVACALVAGSLSSEARAAATPVAASGDRTAPGKVRIEKIARTKAGVNIRWQKPPVSDGVDHIAVVRKIGTRPSGPGDGVAMIQRRKDQPRVYNDFPYVGGPVWYGVFAVDKAGNVSQGAYRVIRNFRRPIPLAGSKDATVTGVPTLSFKRRPGVDYYNLQIYRGACCTDKKLSVFPTQPRGTTVTYKVRIPLVTGTKYTWFVYAHQAGRASAAFKYLGGSSFKIVK